jgi:hypothetical protein
MTTQWVRDQMSRAQQAFGEKRDRAALKHILEVLSVYPSEEWARRGAAGLLKVNMETLHRNASKEPLTPTEMQDPRFDSLFCSCDILGCTAEWISAKVAFPDYSVFEDPPLGGQCRRCGKYFCEPHFGTQDGYVCKCQCGGDLIAAPPPNGRPSSQTARLNKPLVHVLVLKEGIEPPVSVFQKIFQNVAPDVLEDSPTVCFCGDKWPETPMEYAMALLARDYSEYLSKEYDVRTAVLHHQDGTRLLILKVFANRPKIVDPTAPARQTNTANAPTPTQKTNIVDALALAQKRTNAVDAPVSARRRLV